MRALDGEPITQVTEAERLLESRRQGLLVQYSKTLSQKQQQQTLKSRRMCVGYVRIPAIAYRDLSNHRF